MLFFSLLVVLPILCYSVDYNGYSSPPTANAGQDKVIHLPQNSVILNGSNSRDGHHGPLTYQWVQVTDLSADMEGSRSPVLHLSNLQLGDYTFKLIVTNSLGESSSVEVHVNVKSAMCESSNTHTIYGTRGTIDSWEYSYSSCVEWIITGSPSSNITLSFTKLKLDNIEEQYGCEGRNHIVLGPLPETLLCGSLSTDPDKRAYLSERDHVWIKLIRNDAYDLYGVGFRLNYIVSPPCYADNFRCDNGRCITEDWKCNGANECGDGSDERNCDSGPAYYAKPETTTLPSTPQRSLVEGTSCTTLYCFVKSDYSYKRKCVKEWEICDGKDDCLWGADEEPARCYGVKTSKKATTLRPTYSPTTACPTIYCRLRDPSTDEHECLPRRNLCDGYRHCYFGDDENKELCDAVARKLSSSCSNDEIYCWFNGQQQCLPNSLKCDGTPHCYNGEDEMDDVCMGAVCNRRLESNNGWFATPSFPDRYPNNKDCTWEIHVLDFYHTDTTKKLIQLRFTFFALQPEKDTDYVEVYDGPEKSYPLLGRYDGNHLPPNVITSTQDWMLVKFHSDDVLTYDGFNATFQVKGSCLSGQHPCGIMESDCYDKNKECDGHWDCPINGGDEFDCKQCRNSYYCGPESDACYSANERCNGVAKCLSNTDEEGCSSVQCGSHNGTFLCNNNHCIYEKWTCDGRDDCGDYSDERDCSGSSRRVIIAAISGSVICALLLTILIGCSCKLYSLRTIERHGGIRHHSPMSRLYAEFLRRTAPPPYHEAMLTSRNYDEVQQERRERLRSSRRARRSNGQRNNSPNSNGAADENSENPVNANSAEQDNVNFVNEVGDTESNDNPNVTQDATENTGVSVDRSNEATEEANSDSDSDSDSSNEPGGNDLNQENVITQDGIEMQATGHSARALNLDDDSSDDSCILNHPSDCDEISQNLDNQSISLDDISMETASASINLELTEISEETNFQNHENGENEESDKDLDCEQENMNNIRRSSEPKDDGDEVIDSGGRGRRNSSESLSSLHSNCTADSDEPLLVA